MFTVGDTARIRQRQREEDLYSGPVWLEAYEPVEIQALNPAANAALVENDRFGGWVRISDLLTDETPQRKERL